MSAGHVITQIRREPTRHDRFPAYSTADLLRGVYHQVHFPSQEPERSEPASDILSSGRSAGNAEKQRISLSKFETNKEEIYMLLANGRGVKYVANKFHIGYSSLVRYLREEEGK